MNLNQSGDLITWLLEPENPSVRYFTLIDILHKSQTDPEVIDAKSNIMTSGIVPKILSVQDNPGNWGDPKRFYTDKYKGTVWQLMMLAELGATVKDPRVLQACNFIFEHSQEAHSGGFSAYRSEKTGGGLASYVIPCLTGNMVWSLIRLGLLNDHRVQKGIEWINTYQRFDDGDTSAPDGWPYDRFKMCWGNHACHMGVVKTLKALAEIPENNRSQETQNTIDLGVEYFLTHHIYKQSHNLSSVSKPGWLRLGFPLMYQSDILEILEILTSLNIKDNRMNDAIGILHSKQDQQGKWKLENSFNGKLIVDVEKKGKPSKWITMKALRILKKFNNTKTILSGLLIPAMILSAGCSKSGTGTLDVNGLRCEYRTDPMGMDMQNPRLSWQIHSDINGQYQTAYQVIVASSIQNLNKGIGDLWDSGMKSSNQSVHVTYNGKDLESRRQVWWKVKVWDPEGNPSKWSKPSTWSMGLLSRYDWQSVWIADPEAINNHESGLPGNGSQNKALPATYTRKAFMLDHKIKQATAYVSARGLYEFYINGQRVGDQLLAPEWTSYEKRISYQTYDVTELLNKGDNIAAASLGEGWYAGELMLYGRFPYGRYPSFLAQIEVEMADGTRQMIGTDTTWLTTTNGPVFSSGIYLGESYDARKNMSGWNILADFEASGWNEAVASDLDSVQLVWLRNEPIKVEKELYPIKISEPLPDTYVLDFGQNIVGWCNVKGTGKMGQNVQMRFGEAINEDGTLYTDNLRNASQTDNYIPDQDGAFEFEPHFTYHGFRYIEISGLSEAPLKESVVGKVIHSSSPFISSFECSDSSLNRLMENIRWTQRANLMSSPNDCPQRDERFGWMGDIQAFAQTGVFNMDLAAFFTKFLQDTRDDQADDGRFPDFAPHAGDQNKGFSGAPAWADAGVFVPWTAYINYADTQILANQFNAAVQWVDYIHRNNPDLIFRKGRNNDYNDWLSGDWIKVEGWPRQGGEAPRDLFATAFFARSTQYLAKIAHILGKVIEAQRYSKLADEIKTAFNLAFVDSAGKMTGNTQGGYALALSFDLLPEELGQSALEYMVESIRKTYNGHLSTGIQTTHRAMLELSKGGYDDLAWKLITSHSFPSWLYMVDNGATTIWERWDGFVKGRGFQDPGMNSLNHWALGSVGEWMWRYIIGLNPDEEQPGWKHFTIEPRPGGGVSWAKGDYKTLYGTISCAWEIKENRFMLDVSIPANSSATVLMPDHKTVELQSGSHHLDTKL